MNGGFILLGLKYKHKNKTSSRKVRQMAEIETLIREIMQERDCSPLFAAWVLVKMLEADE